MRLYGHSTETKKTLKMDAESSNQTTSIFNIQRLMQAGKKPLRHQKQRRGGNDGMQLGVAAGAAAAAAVDIRTDAATAAISFENCS